MGTPRFQLAQANIARMRASLEDPIMRGFVDQLEAVNSAADRSRGFVWRLQTEEGDATALRVFEDDRILFNMSVWESIEALQEYVYGGRHSGSLRDRRQWFERLEGPSLVLWWVEAGHIPTVEEAKGRLELLREKGPSPGAFTFRSPFASPGDAGVKLPDLDARFCEWAT